MSRFITPRLMLPVFVGLTAGTLWVSASTGAAATRQLDDGSYCWHDKWDQSSQWFCSDTSRGLNSASVTSGGADTVTVITGSHAPAPDMNPSAGPSSESTVTQSETRTSMALEPGVDAIFMSHYSVINMFVPALRLTNSDAAAALLAHITHEWGPDTTKAILVCQHGATFPYKCTTAATLKRLDPSTILRVELLIHTRRATNPNDAVRLTFKRGTDAVFLSQRRCKEYLLSYYQRRNDKKKVADFSRALAELNKKKGK